MARSPIDRLNRDLKRARARLMGRVVRKRTKLPGTAPGTVVHQGERKVEEVRIQVVTYGLERVAERAVERIEDAFPLIEPGGVTWINVDGIHDTEVVEALGEQLRLHRLVLEDVVSPSQRAKVEDYEGHLYLVLRMLSLEEATTHVTDEQLSLILADGVVVSFQERPGDVFEPVRERIRAGRGLVRTRGADYLAYALIDAVVDHHFTVLEQLGDAIEKLEDRTFGDPDPSVVQEVHHLRRELLVLRKSVWPLREMLAALYRGESPTISAPTRVFLRDVHDHAVQVIDTVETLRDLLAGTMDLYLSNVSNRMNEIMKLLTIMASIFIPLSFLAGVYGMNFDWMPELHLRWAYPALLVVMLAAALGMLAYFRRRGWL